MKLGKRLRAAAALLLSAVMLLWTGLPVSAAENTFVHTGSPSQDILAAAESQLGYIAPADGAKYNRWYGAVNGNYTYSWCQTFLSWCAEQAEIGTDVFPKAVSVASAYAAFAGQKRYQKSAAQGGSYTPRAGDVAFYSENGDADALSHVGLVTGTADGTLYTIEGNVSNQVQRCERQLDSVQIIGYGCPLYADLENRIVPELPVMTVTPGMTNLATSISWTASAHAQKYLLVIWDADGNEVVREETTGVRFQKLLPDGDYTAQLTAENSGTTVTTEKQAFTVTENHNPLPFSTVVNAGTDEEPSTVSWTESVGALSYRVCFLNADTGQVAETLETDNTVRTCEKQLEPGNYTVQVTACSGSYETASPVLSFTVKYRRPVTAPEIGRAPCRERVYVQV